MTLNAREKMLAVLLALTAAGMFAFSLIDSHVLVPYDAAQARVSAAKLRCATLQGDFRTVEHAQLNLRETTQQSLPEDPSVASVLYQEWLLQRCSEAGFFTANASKWQSAHRNAIELAMEMIRLSSSLLIL